MFDLVWFNKIKQLDASIIHVSFTRDSINGKQIDPICSGRENLWDGFNDRAYGREIVGICQLFGETKPFPNHAPESKEMMLDEGQFSWYYFSMD